MQLKWVDTCALTPCMMRCLQGPADSNAPSSIVLSNRGLPGWDVFVLSYSVDEPVATVLDGAAMQAYQRVAKLLWLLKRAEHSLNEAWVELNGLQRQLSAFPALLRRTGLRAYSAAPILVTTCPGCHIGCITHTL